MQDKKEKILRLLSIILPIGIFVLLAVVIGVLLSATFRVIDTVRTTTEESEPENTRRTIIFEGEEIFVSDDATVNCVPSVKNYLDGLKKGDMNHHKRFVDGVRRVYEEKKDLISLEDLTPYDYRMFLYRSMDLLSLHQIFPIEILIPIDDEAVCAVYKLQDGNTAVYAYIPYIFDVESGQWYGYGSKCIVSERLTYKDVSKLQVGDTLQAAAELCPAIHYQVLDMFNYAYILLEEGLLRVDIETADIRKRPNSEDPEYEARLETWMKETTIADMTFFPIGNTRSDEEESDVIGNVNRWMSALPFILLPE